MLHFFKSKFFETLIWLVERHIQNTKMTFMSQEQEHGIFAQLWQNEAFRNYVGARNLQLIHELAGGNDMKVVHNPEYLILFGQRLENLYLAAKAKSAYEYIAKQKNEKAAELAKQEQAKS